MQLAKDLLVGADAAAIFTGLTRRTIYHLVERNEVPHRRIGARLYFRKSALNIYFGGSEQTAPPEHSNENHTNV